MILNFEITNEYEGVRLDSVLAELIEELSRSQIQKLFSDGKVKINGAVSTSKKYQAKTGDIIDVEINDAPKDAIVGEDIPLNIVYEDHDYLVLHKDKGVVVHPGVGNESGTLVNGIINHLGEDFLAEMREICSPERPGVVHRIDKDTTGLLVFAKTRDAFQSLSRQFKEHSISRRYKALVYNNFKEDQGRIDLPIGRNPKNRLKRAVNGIDPKPAVTNYVVIERMGKYNLIDAYLETGRTHQIRVHMSHIGHPVVGDPMYGPRRDTLSAGGQMLHAELLGFQTLSGDKLEFQSPLPKQFLNVLDKARRLG